MREPTWSRARVTALIEDDRGRRAELTTDGGAGFEIRPKWSDELSVGMELTIIVVPDGLATPVTNACEAPR